ncbi:MAG: sulfatase-like hydrolase/transferase [Phycisphaeraceae bacterium]|nr:MAG: sulfatase-like hydrolase/transferase [Phycisphaeraceae bacterium]
MLPRAILLVSAMAAAGVSAVGTAQPANQAVQRIEPTAAPPLDPPPNILWIISDDAGWADLSFNEFGGGPIPTPSIDSIADRGVWFSDAYTGQQCAVSRARMFLGLHNQRTGFAGDEADDLDPTNGVVEGLRLEDTTVFEAMKDAGYDVAFFGKWHLGTELDEVVDGQLVTPGNLPPRHGIDYFLGITGGQRSYFFGSNFDYTTRFRELTLNPQTNIVDDIDVEDAYPVNAYTTDVLADEAANFIAGRTGRGRPFFVVLSFTAPHLPLQAIQRYFDYVDAHIPGLEGDRRTYAAMMVALDFGVGTILDRLDDPNSDGDRADSMLANTLVCFINDNGGREDRGALNDPLRGMKGDTFDGGIRVPMCMAGPGIPPGLGLYAHPVDSADLMPTFMALAGLDPPAVSDGVNLLPYLDGTLQGEPHQAIMVSSGIPRGIGLRAQNWKFTIENGQSNQYEPVLYDIASNLEEDVPVTDLHPDAMSMLVERVNGFEAEYERLRWGDAGINQFDVFDYRSTAAAAAWGDAGVWAAGDADAPVATMTRFDGYANLHVRFPARDTTYRATNDLQRSPGFPQMLNSIEHFGQASGDGSMVALDGLPLVFVDTLDGQPPRISENALYTGLPQTRLELAFDVSVWDDLTFDGSGHGDVLVSGDVVEARAGRSVSFAPKHRLVLSGDIRLSGDVRVLKGTTVLAQGGRLDAASVLVKAGAVLELAPSAALPDCIADDAAVSLASGGGTPALVLNFAGTEVIGSLVIDGMAQPAGNYTSGTNPGLIAGSGKISIPADSPCNAADIARPYGRLDLADISAFARAFVGGDPLADLAEPTGVLDLADVSAFVSGFIAGCP